MFKYSAILLLAVFICGDAATATSPPFDPWGSSDPGKNATVSSYPEGSLSPPGRLLRLIIQGFRKTVTAVDGDRCRMLPTCSTYSLQAIETHGFLFGILLTVDRLLHETDEMELAPVVMVDTEARFSDPLSANDFWWNSSEILDKQPFMGNLAPQEQ